MSGTLPGGYFYNTDRKRHEDAWGNPVTKHSDAELKKAVEKSEELTPEQADALAQQAQATRAANEARAAADEAEAKAKAARVVAPRAAKSAAKRSGKGK